MTTNPSKLSDPLTPGEESSEHLGSSLKVPTVAGIVAEGYLFFIIALSMAILSARWSLLLSLGFLVISAWVLWFFRSPPRNRTYDDNEVVSPADGKILSIEHLDAHLHCPHPSIRICVFMNVFNVHVNRLPISGTVTALRYHPGKFMSAFHEKASLENEQMVIDLQTSHGPIVFSQIAGWVARRVISKLAMGEQVKIGQAFGWIRFGSRCDVYLPTNANVLVAKGQKVQGGLTRLAEFSPKGM